MSVSELLRYSYIESLLALAPLELLVLGVIGMLCLGTAATLFYYATREPVYISASLSRPFWRKRITHRICALSLLALLLITMF